MRIIGSHVRDKIKLNKMRGYCIILANTQPRKMINFVSFGIILYAVKNDKYELIRP